MFIFNYSNVWVFDNICCLLAGVLASCGVLLCVPFCCVCFYVLFRSVLLEEENTTGSGSIPGSSNLVVLVRA